jgi:hypothetical protein
MSETLAALEMMQLRTQDSPNRLLPSAAAANTACSDRDSSE